nr:hypothetical protein [Deltaproteobacteria bacterium]
TLGTVPKPLVEIAPAGPAHALAIDGDAATFLVELATAGHVTPVHALGSRAASMAATGELLVALDREGGVELVDPLAKQHWLLAAAVGATFASPQLSPDGKRVLATTATGLVVWTLDLPVGAEATAKWLDVITNAERRSDGELIWR